MNVECAIADVRWRMVVFGRRSDANRRFQADYTHINAANLTFS